jgi:hypothetical protein
MLEFFATLGIILGVGAFINSEKLRKRLNLTQDLLVKNNLIKRNDFIPGWREKEDAKRANMTEEEKKIEKIVKKW